MPVVGFFRWLSRILSRKQNLKIGLIGSPNSGKTTLANRICMEWCGEEMGESSHIPHETRVVQSKTHVKVNAGEYSLTLDLFDTPGLADHDGLWEYYKYFLWAGIPEEKAFKRLQEAKKGITHTLNLLKELDAVILVLDLSKDPSKQACDILIDTLAKKKIPLIIAANKIDLISGKPPEEDYDFLGHPVIPISALNGNNMEQLYKAIYTHLKK